MGPVAVVTAGFGTLAEMMTDPQPANRYRFGVFEADWATGELRRKGLRVRLHAQPFQLLFLFLRRPGETLTREDISRELWPDGTFVDYEQGVNSAVNRLREALGDKASNPTYVETLARRGYRFLVPVEPLREVQSPRVPLPAPQPAELLPPAGSPQASARLPLLDAVLAKPEDLPDTSPATVQTLFILLQLLYLGFYVGALANLPEISDLLSALPHASFVFDMLIVTAAILIPVRTFLLCAVAFRAPDLPRKFLNLWRWLLPLDILWSLAPFLLLHHLSFGLALAFTTFLVYSPFAQRSLVLMGAGNSRKSTSNAAP